MSVETSAPTRLMLRPADCFDPRLQLDDGALVEASRNAFPVVATQQVRKDSFGLMAGAGIALFLGAMTFFSMSGSRQRAPEPSARGSSRAIAPVTQTTDTTALPATRGGTLILPSVPGVPMPLGIVRSPQDRPVAPLMVFDGSAPAAAPTEPVTPSAPPLASNRAAPPQVGTTEGNENDQFTSRIGAGAGDVANAKGLANPASTVVQGTLIPAVLETAIDTDLPGYARAIVSSDVKSFNGAHVLVPRSSRLIGQYKSGLTAGQTRVYVIWTRLIRPDGVSVALASPAIANDGRSGLDGKVDGHFMKRFGSAFLLSVVGGLSSLGSTVFAGGQSAASVAAQRDSAIPPTIHVAPGQPIRVFTARDLDFASSATVDQAAL